MDPEQLEHVNNADGGIGIIPGIIIFAFVILMIASMWKVFTKAGEPGWAVIVPIYNIIVMLKIAGKPLWWIILYLIPIVSLVIAIMVSIGIAEKFGKGAGYGIGLAFLPFIFFPMLAFGDAVYIGPKTA